nr:MAG TPA: hypothetical protein [Caudoviricetes sp.]
MLNKDKNIAKAAIFLMYFFIISPPFLLIFSQKK